MLLWNFYWKLKILRYLFPLLFPRPKILVVLFRNDDQTWEAKGKKRTSKYRRNINGLKASKNWDEWKFFILKFFSRAIEISRQFCASSSSFSTEKIQPLRRSIPHVWKGQKSHECPTQSSISSTWVFNSTIDLHFLFFLCVTNLSQNSLLDASTDEAENEFAKYQLGL